MYITKFPEILHPPERLYYRGNIELIWQKCVAIIGTRKPSEEGIKKTVEIVQAYKDNVIISGGAIGIDMAAHLTAMKIRTSTIMVLPDTVDHVYPSSHTDIANRIVELGGLLLSEHEFPCTQSWELRTRLIDRNRIITGIASLVIPVEFNRQRSGTLHAIRYAEMQKKEIRYVL